MQIIQGALSPERLAQFRKMFDPADNETATQRAAELDKRLRANQEAKAETDDRNRYERRKSASLVR